MPTTQENPKPPEKPAKPAKSEAPSGMAEEDTPIPEGGMFPSEYNPGPFEDGDGKNSDYLKKNVEAAAEAVKEREKAEKPAKDAKD